MLNILHVKPNFYQTDSSITSGIYTQGKRKGIPEEGETMATLSPGFSESGC
jgi:hypothetical protein